MAEQNTASRISAGAFRAAQRQSAAEAAALAAANNTQNYTPIPEMPGAGVSPREPRVRRPSLDERAANRNAERIRAASGSRLNLDNRRTNDPGGTNDAVTPVRRARSPQSIRGRLNAMRQISKQALGNTATSDIAATAQAAGEAATHNAYRTFMYTSAAEVIPGYLIAWCMSMLQGVITAFGDFFISESTELRPFGSAPVSMKNFPRLGISSLQQLGDSLFFAFNFIIFIAIITAIITTLAMVYSFVKYFNDLGISIADLVPGTTFFNILQAVFSL